MLTLKKISYQLQFIITKIRYIGGNQQTFSDWENLLSFLYLLLSIFIWETLPTV